MLKCHKGASPDEQVKTGKLTKNAYSLEFRESDSELNNPDGKKSEV